MDWDTEQEWETQNRRIRRTQGRTETEKQVNMERERKREQTRWERKRYLGQLEQSCLCAAVFSSEDMTAKPFQQTSSSSVLRESCKQELNGEVPPGPTDCGRSPCWVIQGTLESTGTCREGLLPDHVTSSGEKKLFSSGQVGLVNVWPERLKTFKYCIGAVPMSWGGVGHWSDSFFPFHQKFKTWKTEY